MRRVKPPLINTGSEGNGAGHAMLNCVRLLLSAGSFINIISASGDNLVKSCIEICGCYNITDDDDPYMTVRKLMYAAGEEGDREPCTDELTLRQCCRKIVRKRLIKM